MFFKTIKVTSKLNLDGTEQNKEEMDSNNFICQ
jgi:hypothetical protein